MVGVTGNKLTLPIILLIAALAIFTLTKLHFLNFAQNFVAQVFAPVQYSVRKLILRPSITSLQNENLELSKQLVDQDKIKEDNKALRDQFAVTSFPSRILLSANIVGSPGETLIIDKGSSDGVRDGMAVIYQDNLLGVVGKSNEKFSIVQLISSGAFGATAETLSNHAQGTVRGEGAGQIILDNVVLSQRLNDGELVVTKGDLDENGDGLAPSLVLGRIASINKESSNLFQTAKIEPLVDSSQLSTVFVMLSK